MTLEPGDLDTGTPSGVGPLHARDRVQVEISGVKHCAIRLQETEVKANDRDEWKCSTEGSTTPRGDYGGVPGKEDAVEMVLVALLARGHVLLEDVPGVGKTTLARSVAAA